MEERGQGAHHMLFVSVPGCYGVDPHSVTKGWKCARCKANAMAEVPVPTQHTFFLLHTTRNGNFRWVLPYGSILVIHNINISFIAKGF